MPLPSKKILYQKITEMRVFPKNNAFIKDSSDNDVPIYYYELVKGGTAAITGVNYTVELETGLFSVEPSSVPDDYPPLDKDFEQYLGSEGDIDIQSQLVQEKARLITGTLKNPYEKTKAIYDFITKNIQYDHELLKSMEQDSSSYTSHKPEDTLVYQKGICYDIAKLFVALSRASNVPARIVRGVAFDPQEHAAKLTVKYGHAWAEIYLPNYGWLTVDPTFGIAKKDAFYCFNNTSHIGEEYGLASAQEFGSLEKGWALQIRAQDRPVRFPVDVDMVIEIERISE
jgi:transglutaminase-like putative cysteine protease